jgi:eukaryotic-like serine/threonine-protein kinase
MRCPTCARRLPPLVPCPRDGTSGPAPAPLLAASTPVIPGVQDLVDIGAGGFSTVFAGRDAEGREVAVKVARRVGDPRFEREAEALRALGPPATPALHATGVTADGRRYLVEERLFGETLAEWLEQRPGEGGADPATVAALFGQVCEQLAAVHRAGIVHRDLKPENVFLRGPTGMHYGVALLDLGLARTRTDAGPVIHAELTRTGQQLGTGHYMAPEQLVDSRRVDERADLYSLGAMLYECLTGRPPFVGDEVSVRHAHAVRRPTPPSHRVPAAAPLDEVVLRCLAKDPEQRPSSANELRAALAAAVAGDAPRGAPRPEAPPPVAAAPRAAAARRTVGLVGVRTSLAVTEIAAAADNEGGQLARDRQDGYLLVFPQPSAEAAVGAALRAGKALASRLAAADLLVVHAAALSVRESARGVSGVGAALDAPASWWPGEDEARVGVVTTDAATALLGGRTLVALAGGGEREGERDGEPPPPVGATPVPAEPLPILGRDELLAELAGEAARAFEGGGPVLTTLVGEVGHGKSRLLRELAAQVARRARVVEVQFRPPEAASLESPALVLARAAGRDDLVLPASGSREVQAKEIARALRPAAGQPTALLVDDAQWADPGALDALELAAMDAGAPLWIAAATGPDLLERRPLWGDRAHAHFVHRLQPLDAHAERTLLCRLLQPVEFVPADLLSAIQEMTRGVPLFAAEIAHALRAGGAIRRSEGAGGWYLAGDELLRVSSTPLAARLADRLVSRLPPGLREFVDLCAVMGDGFARADVQAAAAAAAIDSSTAGGEPLDASVALDRLVRERVLRQDLGGRCRFRHPMLRAAIEDAMPAGQRRRLHRIVLDELSGRTGVGVARAVIARHAEGCGAHEEAFLNHFALAEDARAAHHYQLADEHYSAALVHVGDADPRRVAALAGRARVRYRGQRFADALQDLRAARTLAEARGDERAVVDALLEEATIEDWRESWQSSAELVARAQPLVERAGDPGLSARWLMALGRTRLREGRLDEAVHGLHTAQTVATSTEDHETWAIASMLLGTALVSAGRLDEAERRFAAVIESCERAQDTLHLCSAYNNRIWLWFKRESLERAISDQRRATALARDIGHVQLERSCTYNLAELLYWRGDLDDALALARRARDLQRRFLDDIPLDALLVARISAARGDFAEARRELEWVVAHCPRERQPPLVCTQVRLIELLVGSAAPEAGAPEIGARWRALVEEARATVVLYELHEVLHFAAQSAVRERRIEDARRHVDEGLRLAGASAVWHDRFADLRASISRQV